MKTMRYIGMAIAAIALCFNLTACGDDDDDPASTTLVTNITLSSTTLTIEEGEWGQITATVTPDNATNKTIKWTQSDARIAQVSASGRVIGINAGTCTITATATDGSGVTAKCKVTVVKAHEAVDLGLSVKWASCNVGASSPEEYGDYYAWGETTQQSTYGWESYTLCKGHPTTLTKYCTSSDYGKVDNKTVLEASDDAATANWGGSWRMPTEAEFNELLTSCTWTWTNYKGVNGYMVKSKANDNSIFLPAAGYHDYGKFEDAGNNGYYWSSSVVATRSNGAHYLIFYSEGYRLDSDARCFGTSVRPVRQ